jgi:hypothetical protein
MDPIIKIHDFKFDTIKIIPVLEIKLQRMMLIQNQPVVVTKSIDMKKCSIGICSLDEI